MQPMTQRNVVSHHLWSRYPSSMSHPLWVVDSSADTAETFSLRAPLRSSSVLQIYNTLRNESFFRKMYQDWFQVHRQASSGKTNHPYWLFSSGVGVLLMWLESMFWFINNLFLPWVCYETSKKDDICYSGVSGEEKCLLQIKLIWQLEVLA